MKRELWSSRTTFLLAAIGSAVGLGNVWRFPYLAYQHGGGSFLIPYAICLFLIGVPLLATEFMLGQKFRSGAVKTFSKINKFWSGLGVFMLINAFIVISYYAVVMAWSLYYLIASPKVAWSGNASQFFYEQVLSLSPSINQVGGFVMPILLCLIVVWLMIYFSVFKGVKSVGKIVWWTVPLPVLLLVILFIRGVTLPGFLSGWSAYLTPNWSTLLSSEVWAAAAGQIFFTLSLGFGVMIAYASFNKKDQDVRSDAWITAITNSLISIFAGFVVFAVLGYMAYKQSVPVNEVVASGPGLAFVVFPEALSLMPLPWLFSLLFFIMLLTLGIDSAFSIVEAINTSLRDSKLFSKSKQSTISFVVCTAGLLAGLVFTTNAGLYFLDIIDHFASSINLLIAGLLQTILASWIFGADKIIDFMNSVSSKKISRKYWFVSLKIIAPVTLLILLINQLITEYNAPYGGYPSWALAIGWAVVIIPFFLFVINFYLPKNSSSYKD